MWKPPCENDEAKSGSLWARKWAIFRLSNVEREKKRKAMFFLCRMHKKEFRNPTANCICNSFYGICYSLGNSLRGNCLDGRSKPEEKPYESCSQLQIWHTRTSLHDFRSSDGSASSFFLDIWKTKHNSPLTVSFSWKQNERFVQTQNPPLDRAMSSVAIVEELSCCFEACKTVTSAEASLYFAALAFRVLS